MQETLEMIIGWCFPVISIILIVLAATRKNLAGKPWLVTYLVIGLVTMLAWRTPQLLLNIDSIDFDFARFYEVMGLPLNFLDMIGLCMLIPFLLAVTNPLRSSGGYREDGVAADGASGVGVTGDTTSTYYGVHGWLRLFVVVNMYIAPALFAIQNVLAFVGFGMLAERYPGIVVVGLIEAAVGTFLVVKWIMIARRLRDIVPGVIREAKKWLLISLAWNVLSMPLVFMSGMDIEDIMPGAIRALLTGLISFTIWYSYFNVSKRVKATYPGAASSDMKE